MGALKSYLLRVIVMATSCTGARVALAGLWATSLATYDAQRATFCEQKWGPLSLTSSSNSQSVAFAQAH
jgi:hypothetical protein